MKYGKVTPPLRYSASSDNPKGFQLGPKQNFPKEILVSAVNVGPNFGPPVSRIGGVVLPINPLEQQLKDPEPYSEVMFKDSPYVMYGSGGEHQPTLTGEREEKKRMPINYQERVPWDPYPMSNGMGLANRGGYYGVVTSDYFWNQRAPGQVVRPSWVDYYDTHYLSGPAFLRPPEAQTPHRLHYGTGGRTWVVMGVYVLAAVVMGVIIHKAGNILGNRNNGKTKKKKGKKIGVTHYKGGRGTKYTILDEQNREISLDQLLNDFPDAYCVDAGGFEIDLTAEDPFQGADVRSGRVALIWVDEESAENDDGAHAIAEVYKAGNILGNRNNGKTKKKKGKKIGVTHYKGGRGTKYTILDEQNREISLDQLLNDFPDAYCVDAGGFEIDLTAEDPFQGADVRSGRVALIWADEESAENDDGAHAIAEVLEEL